MEMLSYKEWLKFYGIEPEMKPCDCCAGTGYDECNSCGGEIECHNCNRAGEIDETRKEYEAIRAKTEKLIDRYNRERREIKT